MKSVQISINYDIETAKAIARRVLEQYAKNNQYLIDSNDVSPMIQDAYKCIGKSYVPTTDDTKGFAKILDKDGDGQVSLSDLERHCIELFCRKSSQYFGGSNPGVPGRSYDLGVGSGPYEQLKKASPPSRTMADQDHLLEVVRRVFKKFDLDGNGTIDAAEVKNLMEETYKIMGVKRVITPEDVQHYLKIVDTDGDGKVSLPEFEQMFLRSMDRLNLNPALRNSGINQTMRSSGFHDPKYSGVYNSGVHAPISERSGYSDGPSRGYDYTDPKGYGSYGYQGETIKRSGIPSTVGGYNSNPSSHVQPSSSGLIDAIRRVFQKFDQDHNGYIDANELKNLLEETYRTIGHQRTITTQETQQYLQQLDTNKDGKISLQEFEDMFVRSLQRYNAKNDPLRNSNYLNNSNLSNHSGGGYSNSPYTGKSYDAGQDYSMERPKKSAYGPSSTYGNTNPTNPNQKYLDMVRRIFERYDKDKNSYIDADELKLILEETYRGVGINKVITDEDVRSYLELADSNHDGRISIPEFENIFIKSLQRYGADFL